MFGFVSGSLLDAERRAHAKSIEILRDQLVHERAERAHLLDELLTMKREGFAPAPAEPGAERVALPDGWELVVAAVAERAGGHPALARTMRAQALAWLKAEVPVADVVARIYSGMGGGDT